MEFHQLPFPGQGKPIPEALGKGEWIFENVIFLSIAETAFGLDPPSAQGRVGRNEFVQSPSGKECIRIDAGVIAKTMGLSVDELLAANRSGKLMAANKIAAPRRFKLTLGELSCEVTIGRPRRS